jgi:tetratricopeptide (TPR) repeat protein
MKIRLMLLLVLLIGCGSLLQAQKENEHIRKGNELYQNKKYEDAEVEYRKALGKNNASDKAGYNLSNSLYRQKRYKEAAGILDTLAKKSKDPKELSRMYHNLGNSLLEDKAYEQSIEAYKKALKQDPSAEDTRYNLSYAKKKLQKQQQQQQQQQQKQNQDKQQQQDQQQSKNQDKNDKQEQQKQDKKEQLNRDEAEQMLDALNRNEKELRKKTDKQKGKDGVPASGKDW